MSRPVRVVAGILLALILVAGAVAGFFWWKVSGLKEALIHDLGDALGARVEVGSLEYHFWAGELLAHNISLTNEKPSAPWDKGHVGYASINFHVRDLWASTLPLDITAGDWNVTLRAPSSTSSETPSEPSPSSEKVRIQVKRLTVKNGRATIRLSNDKELVLDGAGFVATCNDDNVWSTDFTSLSVTAGALQGKNCSVKILGEPDKITASDLKMDCGSGSITGQGTLALTSPHKLKLDLKATDMPVTMLVAVDWQMKLSGLANGTLHYEGDDTGGTAQGQLAVSQGKFNILPWLGKVTSLVSLPDISNVELDKATTDFSWKAGTLLLTNVDVRKNDVARFAGTVDINPTGLVDGKLKLGLPSAITSKWPDLQTKVFSVKFEDFNWTEVHLTGTPDHLQEDLTPRLLATGLQEGSGLIDQATRKAGDLYKSFMGN